MKNEQPTCCSYPAAQDKKIYLDFRQGGYGSGDRQCKVDRHSPFDGIPPLGFVRGNIPAAIFQDCQRKLKFFVS
jgi:hypothetical protein